ncbi:MAG: hypothetical protein JKY65_30985 [Planctomycetes bacterium]|nr:hypothetical protein [Planctomycetota bacterium]
MGNDYHEDEGGGIPGWLYFILIYGGINVVLYLVDAPFLLIPIPRR